MPRTGVAVLTKLHAAPEIVNVICSDWEQTENTYEWLLSTWADIPDEPGQYSISGLYDKEFRSYVSCLVRDLATGEASV